MGNMHAALYPHDHEHEHGRMKAPRADSPCIKDAGDEPKERKYGKWNPVRRPIDPVGLVGSPSSVPKKKLKDQGGRALNAKQVIEQPSANEVSNGGQGASNQAVPTPTPTEVPISEVDMEGANEQTEEGATPNANVGTIVCLENNACDTANDQKDKKEPDDVDSVDLEDFDEFIEKPEPGKGTRNAKERTHPELLKGVGDAGGLDYSTEPTMAEFLEAAEKDELSETEEIKNAVARQRRDQERRAETKRDHELTIESKREAPGMWSAKRKNGHR